MGVWWKWNPLKLRVAMILAALLVFHNNLNLCCSINSEGLTLLKFRERVIRDPFNALSNWNYVDGDLDPCSWDLKNLCLEGTLTPELGKLAYVKSIILRNNSFSGNIPKEIGELKELEILDFGYNNFSGAFPSDLGNNLSLSILLLDNNKFLGSISSELYNLKMLSELQVGENQLSGAALGATCNSRSSSWNTVQAGDRAQRSLLEVADAPSPTKAERHKHHKRGSGSSPSSALLLSPSPSPSPSLFLSSVSPSEPPFSSISSPPSTSIPSPAESPFSLPNFLAPSPLAVQPPSPASPPPVDPPVVSKKPPDLHPVSSPAPSSTPSQSVTKSSKSNHHIVFIWSGVIGGSVFIFVSALGIFFCKSSKMVTVKPWVTGLSGQLQKAFVTGVPKLQRSELETACEDFSNIIASLSDGTVYKGTLSSGVEIAVTATAVKSAEDWPKNLESQFRNKIEILSKVNHKNFVNLIGHCEEEEPFTRMMVFEYAPNGTLFEHLHIKEAEHLDWGMRLRIAMGMAYCLEYMHQLNPPIAHKNLQSSSICLTEDYAAKISDFSFWNEVTAAKIGSATMGLLETQSANPESNVYSFGLILLEIITGRLPYSVDSGSVVDWASNYLRGEQLSREMVDPTLNSFQDEELTKLLDLVKVSVHPDPKQRPTMREVTAMLKEITAMGPDGATPKVSPLWWAELEILSSESS
ncbi:unnamed protein product [Ilex paraguariensis]|uniref:Protein kinase domain-containing protein n=1 Tax=Ilex paraguariensis TaxID=185542 RepID=A0ABC8T435_9AQUA